MTIGGLWHGAAWHFVLWGLLCGVLVALGHLRRALWPRRRPKRPVHSAMATTVTFNLHCATLVLFRCPSVEKAVEMYSRLAEMGARPLENVPALVGLAGSPLLLALYRHACDLADEWLAWRPRSLASELAYAATVCGALLLLATFAGPTVEFFYFQF